MFRASRILDLGLLVPVLSTWRLVETKSSLSATKTPETLGPNPCNTYATQLGVYYYYYYYYSCCYYYYYYWGFQRMRQCLSGALTLFFNYRATKRFKLSKIELIYKAKNF